MNSLFPHRKNAFIASLQADFDRESYIVGVFTSRRKAIEAIVAKLREEFEMDADNYCSVSEYNKYVNEIYTLVKDLNGKDMVEYSDGQFAIINVYPLNEVQLSIK